MAKKQDVKQSEARILIYLRNASPMFCFAKQIGMKLGIDYGYLIRILSEMKSKEWINSERRETKVFYFVTPKAPLEISKKVVSGEEQQPPKQECDIME